MKKKKENLNFNFKVPKIDPNSDDVFKIDPKLEKAIYNKRDTSVSIMVKDHKGQPQYHQFTIFYRPETDTYKFCNGPAAQAHFLVMIAAFMMVGGLLRVITALDEISHQKFLPDGRSVAVPFMEIRTFYSDGKKINQFNALDVFMETITDSRTGQINLNAIDKSKIFCDETNRFSAAEMLEKIKNNVK